MIKASKKMALIMAITMLFTTFATCMISTAAPANLFTDGDFEIGIGSWRFTPSSGSNACSETATGFYVWDKNADPEGTTKIAQNKDNSLLIQPGGSAKQVISGIKPFTSYTLSYWVRTSTTADVKIGPSIDFLNASDVNVGSTNSFGWPSTFLQAETNEWKKVEFQFTSPDIDTVAKLAVFIANIGTEAAYLDNFSLIEDGGDPNYYRNGSLELYNEKGQPWMWYAEDGKRNSQTDGQNNLPEPIVHNGGQDNYWNAAEQKYTVGGGIYMYTETGTDGAGAVAGNRCFKYTAAGGSGTSYMFQPVNLPAGNYKLSFRFKSENAYKKPTFRIGTGTTISNFQQTTTATDTAWIKYDYYFTLPTAVSDYQIRLLSFVDKGTHYLDDIVLTPDTKTESIIGPHMYTPATEGCETRVGETYFPVPSVADAVYASATRLRTRQIGVKTRYVPTTESEDFTVLNCIYKRGAEYKWSLASVSVNSYTATAPMTVAETIEIPSDGGIYKVESLIWDSVSGLRPIEAAAVLPN